MNRIERTAWRKGVYFVAEIGQNHQGDLNHAKCMVDSLIGTGVAAIKTSKRDVDVSLTETQKRTPYKTKDSFGPTYYEHRKALEFSDMDFLELKIHVEKQGFDFIASYTDRKSLTFLQDIGVEILKLASSRLADIALVEATVAMNRLTIISTGMSNFVDVDRVVSCFPHTNPPYLLQCTSAYPCLIQDVHLSVMRHFKVRYKQQICGVGLSGHYVDTDGTPIISPDIAAYCAGATIIERHYTMDRKQKGSDHKLSLERNQVIALMRTIWEIRQSMGDPEKRVLSCEKKAIKKLRADLEEAA